jgi:NADH-quinone oxidoreductase subunit C
VSIAIGAVKLAIDDLGARLGAELGADLADLRVQEPDTLVARVDRRRLRAVAAQLKGLAEIAYDSCNFVAAVDHVTHLETVYHLYSYATNSYIELHVEIDRDNPVCDTICDLYPAADWHEREAWDMMGVRFDGHPDLRRILLKDDWIGHPLRKDYVDLLENHPNV